VLGLGLGLGLGTQVLVNNTGSKLFIAQSLWLYIQYFRSSAICGLFEREFPHLQRRRGFCSFEAVVIAIAIL